MRAVAAGLSDVGLQREHNEDSFVVLKEHDLFVVADGMGGHRAGDIASRIATETISEFFRTTANEDVTWPFHFDMNLSEEENRLLTGIRVANRQIFERSTRSRECHGMGTTVVGAMFSAKKQRMYIGHVGDSRCYRVRAGQIRLLTRDHTMDSAGRHKFRAPNVSRFAGVNPRATSVYGTLSGGYGGQYRRSARHFVASCGPTRGHAPHRRACHQHLARHSGRWRTC